MDVNVKEVTLLSQHSNSRGHLRWRTTVQRQKTGLPPKSYVASNLLKGPECSCTNSKNPMHRQHGVRLRPTCDLTSPLHGDISNYATQDKQNAASREHLGSKADFVGAIRL